MVNNIRKYLLKYMSLKIYCKCGQPTEYTLQKPNFCAYCCAPFNESSAVANKISHVKQASITPKEELKHFFDTINVDDFKFNAEVESFGDNNGIKFSELAQQRKTGFSRPVNKKINVKKEIEKFRAEASAPARIDMEDSGRDE